MTTDEFDTRYKLLKQITTGEGRSFTAQECGSGRAVLVHFVADNGSVPGSSVAGLVDRLEPRDRSKILDILAVDRSTVVVTQFLEHFEGFDAWLQGRLASSSAPRSEPSEAPPSGEFTKLFDPAAAAPPDSPPPSPRPPPAAATPGGPPPGSFTELFRSTPESNTNPIPVPPSQAAAAPEVAPRGGFTELFRPPPDSRTDPAPAPAASTSPVELRSIRIPLNPPAPPKPVSPPRPVSPPPAWPSTLEPPQSPPLRKPVVPMPRLGPKPGEPIVKPPARDVLPAPPPVPGWGGESDYTRLLRPVPTPAEPASPVAAPPRAAGSPPSPVESTGSARSIVPLLLLLNIVVVIATAVILYFALKR